MQICLVFSSSLVIFIFSFLIFSMFILLFDYYIHPLYLYGLLCRFYTCFSLNSCLEKTWNWLEQVGKQKESIWKNWSLSRVDTQGTTRYEEPLSRVGTQGTTRYKGKRLEGSRLRNFCILVINSSRNIQIRLFKLLWKDKTKI